MVSWNGSYANGYIPTSAMVDYDGLGHYLQVDAAASLRAFSNAFQDAFGTSITISEGYRNYATQVYYWNLYQSGRGNVAAVPGTSSHGAAVAADFNSWIYGSGGSAKHNWLVANAPRFGWSWELVGKPSGESWHFNYVGPTNGGSSWAGGNSTAISNEDDMPDAATTETIVRDQVGAILRDKYVPQIINTVTGNLNTSLETIQKRIQTTVTSAQDDLKNAVRRDNRYRLFQRIATGEYVAIFWATGSEIHYGKDDQKVMQWDVEDEILAPITVNGKLVPENPVRKDESGWPRLLARAAAVRAQFEEANGKA